MSNHYQALKQIVSDLPENTQAARLEAYNQAHRGLVSEMKSRQPPVAPEAIESETQAFKQAAVRVEVEFSGGGQTIVPMASAPAQKTAEIQQFSPRRSEGPQPGAAVRQTAEAQPSGSQFVRASMPLVASAAALAPPVAEGRPQAGQPQQQQVPRTDQLQQSVPQEISRPSPAQSGSAPDQAGQQQSVPQQPASAAQPQSAPPKVAQPQAAPKRRQFATADLEFLPAALEILETPPSPIRVALMFAICAFMALGLAWSYFGYFDIIATAQGKLQPTGRVNVVQPLETGKVRAIRVNNGSRVKDGDILLEMDSGDARSDVTAQGALLASLDGEIARRKTAGELIAGRKLEIPDAIVWPASVTGEARSREERVLASDIAQLKSTIASLSAQRIQKQAERSRIAGTIGALEQYVKILQERVDMRQTLVDRNAGARSNVIDALEKLNEQKAQQTTLRGQLEEVTANLEVIEKEIDKAYQSAAADNNQRLLAAQRQQDETAQRLEKANIRLANTILRAPNAGVVQAISVVNIGQVVSAGEQIMRVVPDGLGLEIEGYVQNKDIGFLKEGQTATIKIDSFPFTKYGTIDAVVTKIARDAIPLADASTAETNPAQSQRLTGAAGAQRTQNLVYQVTLRPEQTMIGPPGEKVQLMPGMTVTIEVKTGTRRIISYLLTPLVETGSTAMRER